MAKGSVAHPECVAQPGVWGDPAAGGPGGEQWHSRLQGSTGGFASLRTRRVRLGRLCTLQIPGWFQRSGHLQARGGGRGRDGGRVGDGRACAVAVCGRRTVRGWVGGGWSAACGACRLRVRAWSGVGRGAWGVGSDRGRHPLIPHSCTTSSSTSSSSTGATGSANLTRLVTAVCSRSASGSRLMLIPNGVVAAPLASSRCELEANRSISSMDALLGTRCLDIRLGARAQTRSRAVDRAGARHGTTADQSFTVRKQLTAPYDECPHSQRLHLPYMF